MKQGGKSHLFHFYYLCGLKRKLRNLIHSMKDYKRILVTSALPYANGPLHIGHLAGAYVPADIYVRYQRLKKVDVMPITATESTLSIPATILRPRSVPSLKVP